MLLADQITVDAASVRETRDGYLVAEARIARTGIQTYTAAEMGLTDRNPSDVIRVYRPPETVFDTASMESATWRPLTNDHPSGSVTADSWKSVAVGMTGDRAKRQVAADGEYLVVPLTMMDRKAIEDWRGGKRELSCGYSCHVDMKSGTTPKGEAYDAIQTDVRHNHVALCDHARGGSKLTFGDSHQLSADEARRILGLDKGDPTVNLKTITFDGLQVADVSPAAEAVINKLQGQLTDGAKKLTDAEAEVVKLKAEAVAKDAEIAKLKDEAAKNKITPEVLRDAGKAYATVVAKAKALGVTVGDNDDTAKIMRAVVDTKMKDVKDEHLQVAFDGLTADIKVDDAQPDPLRQVLGDGPRVLSDGADVRNLARTMQYN